MDAVFNTNTSEAPVDAEKKNVEKKEKMTLLKESLKETVQNTPDFDEKLHRLSDSVEVVNTLGYGIGGNVLKDKENSDDEHRKLKPTSKVVGYVLKNVGTEAIEYKTEVYAKGEDGKYVGTVVTKTLAPGESVALAKQYVTMFAAKAEISFTFKNGILCPSSSTTKKNKSLKDELSSYHFKFSREADGTTREVNDDEVKMSIDVDGVIKPEYEETFGYLNNPAEARKTGGKKRSYSTQDLYANYINKLLAEQGIQ